MSDPNNVSPGAVGARIDMSAAPGGDLDWDSLFPNPELAAQQPQVAPGITPQPAPQADQWFLRSADGKIVYRTAEDAIQGYAHKDAEIERLRSFVKSNGVDPNSLKRVEAAPQVQTPPQTNQRFYDKVAAAATNHDPVAYETAMREFFNSIVDPWRPTLAEMNRYKAVQQVSREMPGFKEFYENGDFNKTLDNNPLLRDMNQIGENDPVAAQRLPEVYRTAYTSYKGTLSVAPAATTPPVNTPTVRAQQPTLQPSALTPPAPTPNTQGWYQASNSLTQRGTNEARKALIEDGNRRFEGFRFEDVGL